MGLDSDIIEKKNRGWSVQNIALKYGISVKEVIAVLRQNSKLWDGVN